MSKKTSDYEKLMTLLVEYFWVIVLVLALLGLTHLSIELIRSSPIQTW